MDIANNNQGASAPADGVRPFDPSQWLARYIELGGGYTINAESVWLHWSLKITEAEQIALTLHEGALRRDMAKREAVKALLVASTAREVLPC
jgi:hypothetical protein